ncbi:LPD38 domain-containing protein [Cytobacillus sp. FSL W8-0315]|uniref:LPD38 domain-containing protein n=1 Tax=Cytobacillus sp. FSL W8-0315 TaxID=2921600 RepID=UPI0030FAFB87
MAWNEDKYKRIFESQYGKGSFDSGLSSARAIGENKARAEYAKKLYEQRKKEQQEAALKQSLFSDNVDNTTLTMRDGTTLTLEDMRRQGAYRISEEIRNDPYLKAQVKEKGFGIDEYVDSLYDKLSNGKFRSQREYNKFSEAQQKEANKKPTKEDLIAQFSKQTASSSAKKKEKKDDDGPSLLKDIFTPLKRFGQAINPFDDVSIKEAIQGNVDDALKTERSSVTKEVTRGLTRIANTGTLGALDQVYKKTNDGERAAQFTNEDRSTGGKVADFGYDALGYLIPGVGAYGAVRGAGLGVKSGSRGLTKLRQLAQEGAITGAGIGAAEVGVREGLNPGDTTTADNLKHIALGGALGAVADPALYGAGKVAGNALARFAKGDVPTYSGGVSNDVINNLPRSQTPSQGGQSNQLFDNLIANSRQMDETAATRSLESLRNPEPIQPAGNLERLRAGRDFEPINRGTAEREPELARVSDVLLDDARQSQGDMNSFRSRINDTPQKKDGNLKGLRAQFIDDVAPLENIEKQIAGKVGSAENSLYKQARLFRGSPEKAHMMVQEQLQPVLRDLETSKIDYKDLRDYALAVHAKDVNENGINSGFTNAEIDDVIRKLGSEPMEAARQKLLGVNNNVLDMLSSNGVLSREQVDAMKQKWPNYMSLFRSFDDDKIEFAGGMNKAMANATNPIKKLEGSSRDVIDPMESMVKNIFKAVNTVEKNKVSTQVAKLAEKDVEGNFIRKLADTEDASRLNVISVLNNGKKEKYEVPPEVYKTLMNLDKESTNTLIKILQKPASMLRAGATLTPEFSLRNPLRDVPHAFIVSESGFNPITDFTYGLVQSIGKGRTIKIGRKEYKVPGELYKQWVKENGGYGNIISMDRELHRQTLKKALTDVNTNYIDVLDPKTYTSIMKKFANPIGVLRTVADVSESATKVGEFRAALRKGVSPQEAAYRARDIMDFGRAGISVREANKVVAFLNANIQGKSKLWRAFKENPAAVTGKAIASVTLPTIGAIVAQHTYSNEKQREILDDAPRWLKDTFYLIPVPGTNQIARIPKPFDLAFAFSNTIERAADYIYKNDKEAFNDWVKQGFSTAAVPTMLTGIAPLVEGMANYSFFRQGPIIPQREQNMEYPDQYDINTTETAKFIGNQINKVTGGQGAFRNFGSPRVIDNTIQGFTGGLGTYGTSAIDYFVNKASDTDKPQRPTKSIDQAPLTRAFLVNQSSTGASLDKLYKLKDTLSKQRGSASTNDREFEKEGLYDAVNDFTKRISEINKEIRAVENSPELTSDEKKNAMDELNKVRNEIARQAMELLQNVE